MAQTEDKKQRMLKLFQYLKEKFPSDRPEFETEEVGVEDMEKKDAEVVVPEEDAEVRPPRYPIQDEEEMENASKFMKSFKKPR